MSTKNKSHQESVWDYPRPPRLEPVHLHCKVVLAGEVLAESNRLWRVLETSHPPVYYFPKDAINFDWLEATKRQSYCEFKGEASYWNAIANGQTVQNVAWSYSKPHPRYADIQDALAFYASRVDACYVDDEQVQAQAGDFYGGWITSNIKGPFKGGPGTWGR